MSMCYIKYALLILFFPLLLWPQENFEGLGETSIAVNHKITNRVDFNYSLRSRYFLYRDSKLTYDQRQLDLAYFGTYKLSLDKSLSFGVQYRNRSIFNDRGNELRLTQQFNQNSRFEKFRFGHRFRFEQRILENLTLLRSRYRFALDFPLNGLELDLGEAYLVPSMEILLTNNPHLKPELDHRTTLQIGWLISENLKLQGGFEYRFEALNLDTQHALFILTSAVLKI